MRESDLRETRAATKAARRPSSDQLVACFAATTDLALLVIDETNTIGYVNPAAARMFGYDHLDMIGKSLDMIIPPRMRSAHGAGVARIARGEPSRLGGRTVEVAAIRASGEEFPIELTLSTWATESGVAVGGVIRDISERRKRDLVLQRLAHQDPLTGLANRILFEEKLAEALSGSAAATGVMMIALDGFKAVNENFGHATGDSLLQALAIRLASLLDPQAVLARFSVDEFVALMPDLGDVNTVERQAAAMVEAFETPFPVGDNLLWLGVSIGAAVSETGASSAESILADADLALQEARQAGGRTFRLFSPVLQSATILKRVLKDELLVAVREGQFALHYQPQVALASGRIIGAEALIRWKHPRRGLLAPAVFLSVLESHALAPKVGEWILDEACRSAARWRRRGHADFRVAVNLFPVQIDAGNLAETVMRALERHRLPPDALELEATETIVLDRDDRTLTPLRQLRDMGVRLAFDDFGTGYASLATLKRFPLTTLKIDRGFVADIEDGGHDAAIVRAVLRMGRDLGLEVVAEGVECAGQEHMLLRMGCEVAQGYRYSPPISADAFGRLLDRWGKGQPFRARRISAG